MLFVLLIVLGVTMCRKPALHKIPLTVSHYPLSHSPCLSLFHPLPPLPLLPADRYVLGIPCHSAGKRANCTQVRNQTKSGVRRREDVLGRRDADKIFSPLDRDKLTVKARNANQKPNAACNFSYSSEHDPKWIRSTLKEKENRQNAALIIAVIKHKQVVSLFSFGRNEGQPPGGQQL